MIVQTIQMMEFMRRAQQEVKGSPDMPSEEVRILRCELIREEFCELMDAFGVAWDDKEEKFKVNYERDDLVEVADAIADLLYVVLGTAVACGINIDPIYQAVHESNMAKFGEGGYRREDGKWMKPPNWQPPNIISELLNQCCHRNSLEKLYPVKDK